MSSGFDQRATDIECPAATWTFSTGRTSATVHFAATVPACRETPVLFSLMFSLSYTLDFAGLFACYNTCPHSLLLVFFNSASAVKLCSYDYEPTSSLFLPFGQLNDWVFA